MMTSPPIFVFDAYGTLFDVHSVVNAAEKAFPGEGNALSQLWRAKQLEYTWLRSLMDRYEDFWQVTKDALTFAYQALKLDCTSEMRDQLMGEYLRLSLFPEAEQTLAALSKKTLAILSNGTPFMLNEVVTHTGLNRRFSLIVSADEVRVYKPSSRVYELIPKKLKVPKENIGFVTSNYFDVAGAKAFGFRVYWVNRASVPADSLNLAPDEEISLLTDIKS
jgi:2-haloacid dehalogenase